MSEVPPRVAQEESGNPLGGETGTPASKITVRRVPVDRARTSPKQESAQGLKALAAAFGLSSPVSLGSFDQDTCSLRTSQVYLFTMECDELSESFPDTGMWGSGEVYELRSSAPLTSESASSSSQHWPTPEAASGGRQSGSFQQTSWLNEDGTPRHPSLAQNAILWPTAVANDAIRLWPTARERMSRHAGDTDRGRSNIEEVAGTWQTPGTDSFRSRGGDRKDEMGLDQEARHWGTPTTRDWKDGATSLENTPVNGLLGRQVLPWSSPPAPQTQDGPELSGSGRTSRQHWQTPSLGVTRSDTRDVTITDPMGQRGKFGNLLEQVSAETQGMGPRRLNPRFVEFLMNFPIGWTELSKPPCPIAPKDSDGSGTP